MYRICSTETHTSSLAWLYRLPERSQVSPKTGGRLLLLSVKNIRINLEFRILRLTFHIKSASKY